MKDVKVSIRDLYKVFGRRPQRVYEGLLEGKDRGELTKDNHVIALEDVSLDIMPGEVFVIMGLSGSGKSTLARCINGLIKPTSGSVFIDDEDLTKMNSKQLRETRRKKISMVFQDFGLFPHLNVLDNVAYGLKIQGIDEEERYDKADEAIKQVGLDGWKMKYPDQLSGGMQQRVGIARALTNDPDILIMDEAFSALDPLIRGDMQDELIELQRVMKKTIIFITHDLDEAIKIGDRIVLMKDGKVIQVGTSKDILMNPADDYVRRFVEDIDKNKVFTASQVMRDPIALADITQNPEGIMELIDENELDSIFVVNSNNVLQGLLRREDIETAIEENARNITKYLDFDFTKVRKNRVLESLLVPLANSNEPIAIVSSENKILGVVVRSYIFESMVGGKE